MPSKHALQTSRATLQLQRKRILARILAHEHGTLDMLIAQRYVYMYAIPYCNMNTQDETGKENLKNEFHTE